MIGFPRPGQSYYQFVFRIDDLTATVVDPYLQYLRLRSRDVTPVLNPRTPLTYTQTDSSDVDYLRRHARDLEVGN